MRSLRLVGLAAAFGIAVAAACSSNGSTSPGTQRGVVITQLKDAPFPSDSVDAVTIFVTRVDARLTGADSAASDSATTSDSAAAHGWVTLASPNKAFNLMTLRNGVSAALDTTSLAAGSYSSVRLVIDPSKSSVTMKNGMVLNGGSTPGVSFPSGSSSGIKVNFSGGGLNVVAGDTTTMMLDFDLDNSFVLRGNTIMQLGLLFKPVIRASVSN